MDYLQEGVLIRHFNEEKNNIFLTQFIRKSTLTFVFSVSLSLYWTPVTQPSSSSKLVTVPSMKVTLEGRIEQIKAFLYVRTTARLNKLSTA